MILKGLPLEFLQKEIQTDLKGKIEFEEIHQFKKKLDDDSNVAIPIFLVTFPLLTPIEIILSVKEVCLNLIKCENYTSNS